MSTHAAIAIKMSSECIRWIYLHWDGDLNFAGRTLANHYLTNDKVKQLIMLGDLSSLHRWVEPPEGVVHNFDNRAEDVTVAYHRDRGECRHIGVLSPEVQDIRVVLTSTCLTKKKGNGYLERRRVASVRKSFRGNFILLIKFWPI